jgi:hypothetical protein
MRAIISSSDLARRSLQERVFLFHCEEDRQVGVAD